MKPAPKRPTRKQKAATSKARGTKKPAKAPKAPESKGVVALAHLGGPIRYDVDTLPRHQSKAVERAMERNSARRPRIGVKVDPNSHAVLTIGPDFGGVDSHHFRKLDAFGTPSKAFADNAIGWLAAIACRHDRGKPTEQELNAVLAAVDGIGPNNEAEAMLAVQMAGCHEAAMKMLARTNQADTDEAVQNYSSAAVKLMRTYTTQLEALAKMRRGGEQTVRVEHVHVYPGGQAIVGNVSHPGGGAPQNLGRPHAPIDPQALAFAPGSPVLCPDPKREAVPVTSGEGEEPVSNARRGKGSRRAQRPG